jgi:hypothetical protein
MNFFGSESCTCSAVPPNGRSFVSETVTFTTIENYVKVSLCPSIPATQPWVDHRHLKRTRLLRLGFQELSQKEQKIPTTSLHGAGNAVYTQPFGSCVRKQPGMAKRVQEMDCPKSNAIRFCRYEALRVKYFRMSSNVL